MPYKDPAKRRQHYWDNRERFTKRLRDRYYKKTRGTDRPTDGKLLGPLRGNWKGGRTIDTKGYVCIHKPEHPNAHRNGYVLEHVLVMEQLLGRCIWDSEEVHHKNGNRQDNRPENLELHTKSTHSGIEMKKRWDSGRMRKVKFNHKRDPNTGKFI